MIAIGVIVIVISICTAATTDAVLPAADSAAAVRARCHPCRVGGPVSGVVVDNDAVAADAPVRRHCRSRRRARRTQRPRRQRRLSTFRGGDCNGNGDGGNGGNGGNGDGRGGVCRLDDSLLILANRILLRSIAATTVGAAAAAESGDRDDVNACD